MFRRVIVATDLSPSSYAVVKCLGGLGAYGVKRCLLLLCLSVQEVTSAALSDTSAYIDRTGMVVANWKGEFTHVPICMAVSSRKKIDPNGRFWSRPVLSCTGQPRDMG